MSLTSAEIKKATIKLGADLCGIAGADRFGGAPSGYHPRDVLPNCQSVIVLASRFLTSTLSAASTVPYTIIRNRISEEMDNLSIRLSYILEAEGATAVPTGAIEPCNWDKESKKVKGIISLKHAGELAGLGKIGQNTLLVNDRFGFKLAAKATEK